jgi:hypothetical protein
LGHHDFDAKVERYWTLKAQYDAVSSINRQIGLVARQARLRREAAQHMLDAARGEFDASWYDDVATDVVVIAVAIVAGLIVSFVSPPLTAVIVSRMGYSTTGRMATKVGLGLSIAAFATSAASQYSVAYLVTGRGSGAAAGLYDLVYKASVADFLQRVPEAVALMSCVASEDMYDTLVGLSKKAAKIATSPEERTVLARIILVRFWEELHTGSVRALADLWTRTAPLEQEFKALEGELLRHGPIPPPKTRTPSSPTAPRR